MSAAGISAEVEALIEFKEGVGVGSESMRWHLRDIARWCEANGFGELDREAAEGYVAQRLERTDPNYSSWVSYVRELGRWLVARGHGEAYVLPDGYARRGGSRLPFLLSSDDVAAFFAAAASYDQAPLRWQAPCLFGLMHSCGLRTGEARGLARDDFDASARTLLVAGSKGHRSRLLPLTDEVAAMVEGCDRRTTEAFAEGREALFANTRGHALASADVCRAFRRIWEDAGLPPERGGRRATPYCFRHHFAYANVDRWGREGRDAMAMLPYLQRYMGHASPDSTPCYVHTSPDLVSGFSGEASSLDRLLPEVGFDG